MRNAKKVIFQLFFRGFRYLFLHFLHKLQLQRGQKQQNMSLLQLMALVVSAAATATETNGAIVPVAVAVVVGAALKKPFIATETNCVATDTVAVAAVHFWR